MPLPKPTGKETRHAAREGGEGAVKLSEGRATAMRSMAGEGFMGEVREGVKEGI